MLSGIKVVDRSAVEAALKQEKKVKKKDKKVTAPENTLHTLSVFCNHVRHIACSCKELYHIIKYMQAEKKRMKRQAKASVPFEQGSGSTPSGGRRQSIYTC